MNLSVSEVESKPVFTFGKRNEAETDLALARHRKTRLEPYAQWRLGRVGAEKKSLHKDLANLATDLGCGRDWIRQRVSLLVDKGPENVVLSDFLKCAPDGGKGKSKVRQELRMPLERALMHAIGVGAKPGTRRGNKLVREFLEREGFTRQRQPSAGALRTASNATEIQFKFVKSSEGDHMVRVLGAADVARSPNETVFVDWTTFSSDDDPAELLYVYDRYGRLLGIANAMFGLQGGTRGLWTLLPIVGAPNAYLTALGLRRGFLDKTPLLQLYGLSGTWPFHGKMGRMVDDQGSEFVNAHLVRTLNEMDVAYHDLSPAHQPHMRAKAERFNRTAHTGMANFLRSEIGKKYFFSAPGKPNATGIKFEHLDRAMIEWATSVYHVAPNKGLGGASPLERLDDMINGRRGFPLSGPLIPVRDSEEMEWTFLSEKQRVINHTGISIENRNYASDALTQFLVPGTRSSGKRHGIRFNPYGLANVCVRDGHKQMLRIPYRHRNDILPLSDAQIMESINPSTWEWRVAYVDLKRTGKEHPEPEEIIEVIAKREAKLNQPDTVISSTITQRDAANLEMRRAFGPTSSGAGKTEPGAPARRAPALLPTGRRGAGEY